MVRNQKNCPALIQQGQEAANIHISLTIDVTQKMHIFFIGQFAWTIFLAATQKHMLLSVHTVHMGENDIQILGFNQIVQRISIPFDGGVPVFLHTLYQRFIL